MGELWDSVRTFLVEELPRLLVPGAVLLLGSLAALFFAALTRMGLRRTRLDERLLARLVGPERAGAIDTARWGGRVVFWVLFLVVAVSFLEALSLRRATVPLQRLAEGLLGFVPHLLGGLAIGVVAWLLAALARRATFAAITRWHLDEKVAEEELAPRIDLAKTVSDAGYWLVLLLFLPAVLGALGLTGLLAPVQSMVDEVLSFLPNLASAALILAVGWFAARIVQRIVTDLAAVAGLDKVAERAGLEAPLRGRPLSEIVGLVLYGLLLIPVVVATLNALHLDAITEPASATLQTFFDAIPALVGAALVVLVGYVAARLLATLVENVLSGVGFDSVMARLGWSQERAARLPPSRVVASIVLVGVLLFAGTEAAQMLGFAMLSSLAADLTLLAGHVLFGLALLALGLLFSGLAADAIGASTLRYAKTLATATRVAILGLVGAMALRQMGIADEIIELGFGIVLGAAGVAAALAFGLGGRDFASSLLDDARRRLNGSDRPEVGLGEVRRKAI